MDIRRGTEYQFTVMGWIDHGAKLFDLRAGRMPVSGMAGLCADEAGNRCVGRFYKPNQRYASRPYQNVTDSQRV